MRLAVLLILLSLTTGCAHTAVVKYWEPAEIDAVGMNRIAVVDFTGDNGAEIASALSSRLWDNDFYTLVDQSEFTSAIQPASYSNDQSFHGLLSAAREAGVNGVIVGSVIQYRCEDQILGSTELEVNSSAGTDRRVGNSESSLLVESKDVLYREGTVTVAFRLVDVETGEVRASKQISRHFQGEMSPGGNSLPEKGQVLETLMEECLEEVVEMLAPHEKTCELKLANCEFWTKGSGKVKAGLKHAADGDWKHAEMDWKAAIQENPENHAAMYNLSIAAARNQEYDTAEQYILNALKCEHKKCYTNGLEKIRERRTALTRANDQREARVASTDDSLWQ